MNLTERRSRNRRIHTHIRMRKLATKTIVGLFAYYDQMPQLVSWDYAVEQAIKGAEELRDHLWPASDYDRRYLYGP